MRTLLHAALLLTSICGSTALYAQSNDAILRKIDDHYNHLSSLQARYTEHYTGMGIDRTESGTLLLKKPGRMRWSYDTPAGKVFILDGKSAWFYTPGNPQAQHMSTRQLDDLRSPLRLLLGHTQLQRELQNVTVTAEAGGYQVKGTPTGLIQKVRFITLNVDSQWLIRSLEMEEVDGATTQFTFSLLKENLPIGDTSFRFIPPAGVTVVAGLPPI